MEQYSSNSQNEFLWSLLDNPANDARSYAVNLQRLVNDFPQSGILQALLAHASEDKNLKQASVYFNPRSLFKLVNAPSTFVGVPDERIVMQAGIGSNGHYLRNPLYDEPLNGYREEEVENNIEELHPDPAAPVNEPAPEPIADAVEPQPPLPNEVGEHVNGQVPGEEHLTGLPIGEPQTATPIGDIENIVAEQHEAATDQNEVPPVPPLTDGAPGADAPAEVPVDGNEIPPVPALTDGAPATDAPAEVPVGQNEIPPVPALADVAPAADAPAEVPMDGNEIPPVPVSTGEGPAIDAPAEVPNHDNEVPPVPHLKDVVPVENDVPGETVAYENEMPPVPYVADGATAENNGPAEPVIYENETARTDDQLSDEVVGTREAVHDTAAPENEIPEPVYQSVGDAAVNKDGPIAIVDKTGEDERPVSIAEQPDKQHTDTAPDSHTDDDIDETFDEIVGIEDINFNQQSTHEKYFSFDDEFGAHEDTGRAENNAPAGTGSTDTQSQPKADADHQDISKYHDEKMPYTFMWWLDKTRREHAQGYQPYIKSQTTVQPKKVKKITDELQQQYFENIFHITSVEDLDKSAAPPQAPYNVKRKEQQIIERFIKEEPQIKPQSSDKLDNENKAKKSSEDRDELVTETLAGIYSDQMLYHKAISSYKKLMLRFPEKSRYFAEKIEQLEKKTN